MSKRLHLIYYRQYLWAGVACQIRTALLRDHPDDRVIVVTGGQNLRSAAALELMPRGDLVADRHADTVADGYDDIQIYVQYSDAGIKEYGSFFDKLNTEGRKVTLNYYPDGFTNKIHAQDQMAELFATRPLHAGTLFQMDHTVGVEVPAPGVADVAVLDSATTRTWIDGGKVREIADQAIGALQLKTKDVLLLLLRPWGSSKYTKGRLEFGSDESDGEVRFAEIIRGLVARIRADIGRELDIVVHPDNRDGEFCHRVLDRLKGDFDFQLAAPDWPEFMSFDAFIHHFEGLTGARLHVVGFDSTASLPFVRLGKAESHYFGAPEAGFPPETADSVALRTIKVKMRSLKGFIAGLPQDGFTVVTFDPLFFKTTRPA